jgi:hypothetical protein
MKPDFQPEEVPLRTPVTYQMLGQILSEENPITYLEYPSLPLTATWAAKPRPQAFPLQASALHWVNAGSWRVTPT